MSSAFSLSLASVSSSTAQKMTALSVPFFIISFAVAISASDSIFLPILRLNIINIYHQTAVVQVAHHQTDPSCHLI